MVESEYRHRYFNEKNVAPLPLDDQFLLFCHHVRLADPGPGKVGLTFPKINDLDDDDCISDAISANSVELLSDHSTVEPSLKRKMSPIISTEVSHRLNFDNECSLIILYHCIIELFLMVRI